MVANTPSDRVQLRSRGELQLPGSCALCGSGNCDDGYLDFSLWIEFHGTVYLCVTCFDQAANVADYMAPDVAQHIKETNEDLAARLTLAQDELEKANELIANWNAIIATATGSPLANAATLVDLSVGDSQDDESVSEVSSESAGHADDGESVAKESVTGERRRKPSSVKSDDESTPEFTL